MSNVKPGDFARVVGSRHGNNGKMCFVEQAPGHWDYVEGELCWFWLVTLLDASQVRMHSDVFERCGFGERVWGNDKRLRRIDPPPEDSSTQVITETKVPCLVT